MNYFRLSLLGTVLAFVIGSIAYLFITFCLSLAFQHEASAFAAWPRMFLYHWQFWYQYIAVLSLTYGATLPIWLRWHPKRDKLYWISILVYLSIVLSLGSIPSGILWQIHDMQAGFFPDSPLFEQKIFQGILWGVTLVWPLALFSVPLNLFALLSAVFLTDFITRKTEQDAAANP